LEDPDFTVERLGNVSKCAAGLCDFVININIYYDIVVTVEPKKAAVAAAENQLAEANEVKREVDELVAKLNSEL
jgi:dynein heavy chain